MKRYLARILAVLLSIGLALTCSGQSTPSSPEVKKDIDPLAMKVLKAVTDPIRNAKKYSFHTTTSREKLGTNGQIITTFSATEIVVERPDKLHANVSGAHHNVQLLVNAGKSVLFSPEADVYTSFQAPNTIDAMLADLEKRDIFLPAANFLASDPYQSLAADLHEAYVIGRVKLGGETVHQLAFTEPHAEWQLWVVAGNPPTIRRLQVINKQLPEHPRITVDFSDWNFNPDTNPALFTFQKPAGAVEIGTLKTGVK
jgi:hypothetical protein